MSHAETLSRTSDWTSQRDEYAARSETSSNRSTTDGSHTSRQNVGQGERLVSVAAGSILGILGLGRRDLVGLGIAGVGAALVYRGATGHCSAYQALGIDTDVDDSTGLRSSEVRATASFLINKPAEELYTFWRDFENLPEFMTHLQSVEKTDERRSHWVAKAPKLYGGQVEWDAEITADEPNSYIAWQALPNSDVEHRGSIRFAPALGDRGTKVSVEVIYSPPGGQLGRWTAKLFGEEPEQQIHADLRNFKRLMETGEILTTVGQPMGTCKGHGKRTHG